MSDNMKVVVAIKMSARTKKKLEEIAKELETSFSELIRQAIFSALPEYEKRVEILRKYR